MQAVFLRNRFKFTRHGTYRNSRRKLFRQASAFPGFAEPLDRAADARDAAIARDLADDVHHLGMRVSVLMRINVGRLNSGRAKFFDLRCDFRCDVGGENLTAADFCSETQERSWQRAISSASEGISAGGVTAVPPRNNVATDTEIRIRERQRASVLKFGSGGHQSCAGENSVLVSANDSLIYSACQAEIIGVQNQTFHC